VEGQRPCIVEVLCINLREFGLGPRRQVDDTPYGGGDGMAAQTRTVSGGYRIAKQNDPEALVLLPTPRGQTYKQSDAKKTGRCWQGPDPNLPRYEGYDERVTKWVDQQYSIGNYVLTGGELPAMIIIDSVVAYSPASSAVEHSTEIESFQQDDENIEFPNTPAPKPSRTCQSRSLTGRPPRRNCQVASQNSFRPPTA